MSDDKAGALLARKTWRTLEPLHGMVYFVPEAAEAYGRLGIIGRAGYFASRAAPMGAVTADVVVSTFFNFNPDLVHAAIPSAWEVASPEALVAARFDAVDAAFRRLLGDEVVGSTEMRQAAQLARRAAEEAGRRVEGRPLAAAHAEVPWPSAPHLVLWHAQSILREYRGDGHIALLVVHGLSGLEALVTHAAAGDVPAHVLRSTRAWSERGLGRGGRDAARSRPAPAGRRPPPDGGRGSAAPGHRGRDGRAGGGALCRRGRGSLRRAAGPGAALEHDVRPAAALRARLRHRVPMGMRIIEPTALKRSGA